MSTERDEYGIYHIDGPAVAGFIVAENPDGSGNRVEIRYRSFRYVGTKAECEEAYKALLNLICSELKDLNEVQPNAVSSFNQKIIWWRRRVDYVFDPESERWYFSCRLATTPPLPLEIWERWETKEGDYARNAKEVCG